MIRTGMKIKTFNDTNIEPYIKYIDDCGFDCYIRNGYLLIGNKKSDFSISKEVLGNKLKAYRLSRHMTRARLSLISGISESYLFSIENGMIGVKDDRLHQICEILGISREQLLNECRKG